jgi:hypothetical protein
MKNESAEKAPRPDSELCQGDQYEIARSTIIDLWNQLGALKKHDPETACPKPSGQTIECQLVDAFEIIDDLWSQLQSAKHPSKNHAADFLRQSQDQVAGTLADYETKMKNAKTPQARAAVAAEFEKAVKENRIAYSGSSELLPVSGSVSDFEEKMRHATTPQARAAIAADFERSVTGK